MAVDQMREGSAAVWSPRFWCALWGARAMACRAGRVGEDSGVRIYVGNLPYSTTEDELRDMFAEHGDVSNVAVPTDRATGRSRGFGFVEMLADTEGQAAIDALNGLDLDGRSLTVNVARPRAGGGRDEGGGGYASRY